jgi:hypothetical protein
MQQADVRERLREVTQQALSDRIVFPAEESDVVLERAQLPEMALGLFDPSICSQSSRGQLMRT